MKSDEITVAGYMAAMAGQAARDIVTTLSGEDRNALIAYLESL